MYRRDVEEHISGVQHSIQESRPSYKEAHAIYTIAYKEGTVMTVPVPGSCFSNAPFDWKRIDLDVDHKYPRQYYKPHPSELRPPPIATKIYTVLKGEGVGIFCTWYVVSFALSWLSDNFLSLQAPGCYQDTFRERLQVREKRQLCNCCQNLCHGLPCKEACGLSKAW